MAFSLKNAEEEFLFGFEMMREIEKVLMEKLNFR